MTDSTKLGLGSLSLIVSVVMFSTINISLGIGVTCALLGILLVTDAVAGCNKEKEDRET